jgi:L-ribulose-5-phosphate 3-epimerase
MTQQSERFQLSLAAWSMHRMFFAHELDQLGMVQLCAELGMSGFEMVNTFFPSPQYLYLQRLRSEAEERGVRLLLIMCDLEGDMAATDREERLQAAVNHRKWVDIAAVLGCHSIRCNVRGDESDPAAMRERAAESFRALLEYAEGSGLRILIENHGGLSSDPDWLVSLVELVGDPRLGTLPDFGNFPEGTDRYRAVEKMMPHAGAVSAKCYDFGPDGNETTIDFARMLGIVRAGGYSGFVGIEYEGKRLAEREGILAAKGLLERLLREPS